MRFSNVLPQEHFELVYQTQAHSVTGEDFVQIDFQTSRLQTSLEPTPSSIIPAEKPQSVHGINAIFPYLPYVHSQDHYQIPLISWHYLSVENGLVKRG